jgi:hypothetical protein
MAYDPIAREHEVLYDDGDIKSYKLMAKKWQFAKPYIKYIKATPPCN